MKSVGPRFDMRNVPMTVVSYLLMLRKYQPNIMKLKWKTKKTLNLEQFQIPCANDLKSQCNQDWGIRRTTSRISFLYPLLYPIFKIHQDLFVDGFIEREIGNQIKRFLTDETIFLEIGCGDMSLRRFLPYGVFYNAFDLEFNEYHLKRKLNDPYVNIAIASAENIPLDSNIASLIIATETFEHIPDIDKAIMEIYRISKNGAKLLCTIPNNYCFKYQKKGPHMGHIHSWTFNEFINFMSMAG
jgi:SAM-dependent methyltransferase